jgi:uncharacterized protein YkwD
VTKFGRRGRVLLLGITTGCVLLASAAVAASASAAPARTGAGQASALVSATNAARREAGCAALRVDDGLRAAAQAHADDMARNGYFDHTSRDGTTSSERIAEGGYPDAGGENIAFGYATASEVMKVWMGSPGHRRNIVNCGFTAIGVGYAADGDHWVQDFGG